MFITSVLFFFGFYILIKGSGWVTDGASALARRLKISSWVIGLVIVGIGTSIPEFSVALISNTLGVEGVTLGTIIGSNTFNILFILGVSAIFFPLTFKEGWVKRDLVWNILAVLTAFVFGLQALAFDTPGVISRYEGSILLLLFLVWLYFSLKKPDDRVIDGGPQAQFTLPVVILMLLVGLVGVFFGGKWVVDGAVAIAQELGWSERLVGLTIIGLGTSLPELAISLVAVSRRQVSLAIGNIVGSNIFDFLMILGLGAVVSPIGFSPNFYLDIWVTLISATALLIFMFVGKKYVLTRGKGAIFVIGYLAYLIYLVSRG
jgi:cation:H+ antiporter